MNRIGLKIACLVVSIIIWVQVAATSVVEQRTSMPLRPVGLSEGFTLAGSDIPKNVDVVVRASKLTLLTHDYFNRYIGEVRINLSGRQPGPAFYYDPGTSDVMTDLVVIGVTPVERPQLHVDRLVNRRFAIELATTGSLPTDIAFLETPTVALDSVLVSGPERFFPEEMVLQTKPVDLGRISVSEQVAVTLVSPHPELELRSNETVAVFSVSPLEDRTLANIPVIPLVDAGLPEVGVSPPVADIMVRGVADSVRALTKSRFTITVPVGNRAEGIYELPGQVGHPEWLTFLRLDPPEFRVIVGNPPVVRDAENAPQESVTAEDDGD